METKWKKIGCNGMYYEEMPQGYNCIFIFVPQIKEIIRIMKGTGGDNFLPEDIKEGFFDYISYQRYKFDLDIVGNNGGEVLLKELFQNKYTCTADCIPAVLDMAYGDGSMEYIILSYEDNAENVFKTVRTVLKEGVLADILENELWTDYYKSASEAIATFLPSANGIEYSVSDIHALHNLVIDFLCCKSEHEKQIIIFRVLSIVSGTGFINCLNIGDVVETEAMSYYLITRMDDNFVYAREVKPYIELGEEIILFTKMYIEKEYHAIGVKNIIDMNEVTRRYLEMA